MQNSYMLTIKFWKKWIKQLYLQMQQKIPMINNKESRKPIHLRLCNIVERKKTKRNGKIFHILVLKKLT